MATMDKLAKKREREAAQKNKGKTSDEKMSDKKAADLAEFTSEAQVKTAVTFFREPFLSNCFVCKRGFNILNDKMASCGHTFNITPGSLWVKMCYMQLGGFELDPVKVAEVETKYSVKLCPPEVPAYVKLEEAARLESEKQKKAADEAAKKIVPS
jgi:hypothetical protein